MSWVNVCGVTVTANLKKKVLKHLSLEAERRENIVVDRKGRRTVSSSIAGLPTTHQTGNSDSVGRELKPGNNAVRNFQLL
jgi:hypothetical protein